MILKLQILEMQPETIHQKSILPNNRKCMTLNQ